MIRMALKGSREGREVGTFIPIVLASVVVFELLTIRVTPTYL